MTTNLRMRQQRKRVFQLSGFADAERKEMGRLITALGGIDFDSQVLFSDIYELIMYKNQNCVKENLFINVNYF